MGRVVDTHLEGDATLTQFDVETVLSGSVGASVEVSSEVGVCGYRFAEGVAYVVVATRGEAGLDVRACSGTQMAVLAETSVEGLAAPPSGEGDAVVPEERVLGEVVEEGPAPDVAEELSAADELPVMPDEEGGEAVVEEASTTESEAPDPPSEGSGAGSEVPVESPRDDPVPDLEIEQEGTGQVAPDSPEVLEGSGS